jgi:enoyl-CoA hydratase/carnithine racemase
VPGPGVARGLAQVNLHWMKLMVLAGERLDAQEARLAGLVNRVAPAGDHLDVARALAERITQNAPLAVAVGKQFLNRRVPDGFEEAIDAVAFLQGTADFAEGISAFNARRDPEFSGS